MADTVSNSPRKLKRHQFSLWHVAKWMTALCVFLAIPSGLFAYLVLPASLLLPSIVVMVGLVVLQLPVFLMLRRFMRLNDDGK